MESTANTANHESVALFRVCVEKVLSNWTALKLAVEHGTGGSNSRELASNFVQYIGDIFIDGGNLEAEDVSDVLIEVMDTQFDTWCEDDSPNEIANFLCKVHQLCVKGNVEELKNELKKLPELHVSLSRELPAQQQEKNVNSVSLAAVQEDLGLSQEMDETMEAESEIEPGWTTVTSRRRHVS